MWYVHAVILLQRLFACFATRLVSSVLQCLLCVHIKTGSTTSLVGSGTVDEDVTSAHFSAVVKALGTTLSSCSGDATTDIVCKLPAGAGEITVKAVDYPLSTGKVTIPVDVKTSFLVPASLAAVDVHIEATEQNGESVICLDVHTKKALENTADEPCCKTCEEPLKKYYSVDVPHGFCGEACLDPAKKLYYKIFEKNFILIRFSNFSFFVFKIRIFYRTPNRSPC
jgi:hypothetical protein